MATRSLVSYFGQGCHMYISYFRQENGSEQFITCARLERSTLNLNSHINSKHDDTIWTPKRHGQTQPSSINIQ